MVSQKILMIILVSDQEPEATCDGNSICSFLQANTQVLFCCCKYTAEPSFRVSMWLSIVSARAFPNVPPRGIPTMASRSPKPSPTSTRWEHVLKHSLTPNSCKMWEFFFIKGGIPSMSIYQVILSCQNMFYNDGREVFWDLVLGTFILGKNLRKTGKCGFFPIFLNFKIATKK